MLLLPDDLRADLEVAGLQARRDFARMDACVPDVRHVTGE
jgi:hypothetical protein